MGRILMEVLELFPTEVFVFENTAVNNTQLVDYLQTLDNVEIKKSTTLSILVDLRKHDQFKDLFLWFDQCLDEVKTHMKYDCDELTITNSWFNVALTGYSMHQNVHRHSMSLLSAVYYLTEGSPTVFEDPVIHRTQAQLEVLRHGYNPFYSSDAKPGKLVIFPSWMYHSSMPHIGSNNRYIISFNCLPSGKINYNLATDSKAHIRIVND